jgi:signal transduction histidine kinase
MVDVFQKLPTVLVVAVLVAIFVFISGHVRSFRIKLWVVAWFLVFLHFFTTLFDPKPGVLGSVLSSIELGTLLLSGVVFLVSLSEAAQTPGLRLLLLAMLSVPTLTISTADSFNLQARWLFISALSLLVCGGIGFFLWRARTWKKSAVAYLVLLPAFLIALQIWGVYGYLHWNLNVVDPILDSTLTGIFTVPGILYWRRFRRWSPGVVTTVGGFFAWGAVWPSGELVSSFAPHASISPELWNVPKFFVAFGMILTLLEEKSRAAEEARRREHDLNLQLQTFADLTSKLLGGIDLRGLWNEVAQSITRVTNFERAAIALRDESKRLHLVGSAGVFAEEIPRLQQCVASAPVQSIQEFCNSGVPLGRKSYRISAERAAEVGPVVSRKKYVDCATWKNGDEVIVPLLSPRGNYIGFISLDDPKDPTRVTAEEMSALELLAGDLAVAVENAALHRQLLHTEKLASIGQLVAGVAHELNNPLTAVIGYSDLMQDEPLTSRAQQMLDTLRRESQRMKRIVQNLLRFARQTKPERKRVQLAAIVREVIALREYNLESLGVRVLSKIADELPDIHVDEDQTKHVVINLLNNAVDAVKNSEEKVVTVESYASGATVVLCISDSGPGFQDVDRALDPFYTTKPVGEGTGLGLSICYGIINEHGGQIRLTNIEPHGACVTVEFPAHTEEAKAVSATA